MNFNKHSNLEGQHAFLGASKYHWINYTDEKIADAYTSYLAAVYAGKTSQEIFNATKFNHSTWVIKGNN